MDAFILLLQISISMPVDFPTLPISFCPRLSTATFISLLGNNLICNIYHFNTELYKKIETNVKHFNTKLFLECWWDLITFLIYLQRADANSFYSLFKSSQNVQVVFKYCSSERPRKRKRVVAMNEKPIFHLVLLALAGKQIWRSIFVYTLNANLIKQPARRKRKGGRKRKNEAGFLSLLCFAFPLISQNARRKRAAGTSSKVAPTSTSSCGGVFHTHTAINSRAWK